MGQVFVNTYDPRNKGENVGCMDSLLKGVKVILFPLVIDNYVEGGSLIRTMTRLRVRVILAHKVHGRIHRTCAHDVHAQDSYYINILGELRANHIGYSSIMAGICIVTYPSHPYT